METINIKKAREVIGCTQEEFARLVGVSFVTVNRWENGHRQPSRLAREKIEQVIRRKGAK
jgi:DNA-binding transcriptional regulator YiaG